MTDFAYPQPYRGFGIDATHLKMEATSKLQDDLQNIECEHGNMILEECDYCETGTEPLGKKAAKTAIEKIIRDLPKYPITVPWLPIEQIGEVFPDWEIGSEFTNYLLKDRENTKQVCSYYQPYGSKKDDWYYGYELDAQRFYPTHFSPVILGDV